MISIMFHSAGLNNLPWRSSHISDPLDIIRKKFEAISKEGYKTLFMRDAVKSIGGKRDKLVHLTFDDGYLDNWVHVFPLLEEFGFKATIFVTTDFVDPRNIIRDRKNAVERKHDPVNCCAGFLSFREMREMESSGLVEIQSHAMTHTWYFKGPEIVDFWHPGAATEPLGPVWMLWNRFTEKKPFYLLEAPDLESQIPYGTPVYEHGKSLETIRFYPDEKELESRLTELAVTHGESFFKKPDWRSAFFKVADEYRRLNGTSGEYESETDRITRIKLELRQSKTRLEEGLGHEIDCLCLPGGGATEKAIEIAGETGYRYFTMPGKWREKQNVPLRENMISRIGSLARVELKGRDLGYPSKNDFKYHLRKNNGYRMAKVFFDISRIAKLLRPGG